MKDNAVSCHSGLDPASQSQPNIDVKKTALQLSAGNPI